jgi:hypothetical protein
MTKASGMPAAAFGEIIPEKRFTKQHAWLLSQCANGSRFINKSFTTGFLMYPRHAVKRVLQQKADATYRKA